MSAKDADSTVGEQSIARAQALGLVLNDDIRTGLEQNLDLLAQHFDIVRTALAQAETPPE